MTEDEALDALAEILAAQSGFNYDAHGVVFRVRARTLVRFLRERPDVARALGIGTQRLAGPDDRWGVLANRRKAHEKHKHTDGGSMESMDPSRPAWLAILVEEVGEVANALTYDGRSALRDELVDVASVATAWIDSLDIEAVPR